MRSKCADLRQRSQPQIKSKVGICRSITEKGPLLGNENSSRGQTKTHRRDLTWEAEELRSQPLWESRVDDGRSGPVVVTPTGGGPVIVTPNAGRCEVGRPVGWSVMSEQFLGGAKVRSGEGAKVRRCDRRAKTGRDQR